LLHKEIRTPGNEQKKTRQKKKTSIVRNNQQQQCKAMQCSSIGDRVLPGNYPPSVQPSQHATIEA
jgi:hypothetical protein